MNKEALIPTPLFREYYHGQHSVQRLTDRLYSSLLPKARFYDLVCVCIGTDRSTGDSLGPLVGLKLEKYKLKNINVYGTLDEPVHALNLAQTVEQIKTRHPAPFIMAIDACLGEHKNIGLITLGQGSLKPGAGVKKELPEIGELFITGIVNVGGFMEYIVLQNTRLSLVMKMADTIAQALHHTDLQLTRYQERLQKNWLRSSIWSKY